MNIATTQKTLATVSKAWPAVRSVLGPIHSERQLERVQALVDRLLDDDGDEALIDTLTTLMQAYEAALDPLPAVRGRAALRFLMQQHGLKQGDLAKELGSQSVVSEVLAGRRDLDVRQVRALARRFRVSSAVFIDE